MEIKAVRKKKEEPITDEAITARLPEDVVALVLAVSQDEKLASSEPEVQNLLPPTEVINCVLAQAGLRKPSTADEIGRADDWMNDQQSWQDRAMSVENQLQKLEPFTREGAMAGRIPGWAIHPWASGLLHKWSSGLQKAVLDAESYVIQKSPTFMRGKIR